MFIDLHRNRKSEAGASLVDYVMSMALGTLLVSAVCAFSFQASRSFATFYNMIDADQANNRTINQMVKDFRMVRAVTDFTTNSITMQNYDGSELKYVYYPSSATLRRTSGLGTNTMLRDLSRLSFSVHQRNMTNDTFDFFPTTNAFECKAVTFEWVSSGTIMGRKKEDMPQKLTVVIRN